ncbi:MAG TPA: T9SS type A sorting domain-containing protein, partial [Candidatus Onthomorpha intestinigallinarum]|nr:T9SS type A sorting domain-containing protein [Candidatus Onthomorpha intestinigallinarum]
NPTDGKCEIRSDYKIIDIELMDIQGRLIKAEKIGGNVYSLDISFLTDGVYIVNINTDRGSVKKKVVKR